MPSSIEFPCLKTELSQWSAAAATPAAAVITPPQTPAPSNSSDDGGAIRWPATLDLPTDSWLSGRGAAAAKNLWLDGWLHEGETQCPGVGKAVDLMAPFVAGGSSGDQWLDRHPADPAATKSDHQAGAVAADLSVWLAAGPSRPSPLTCSVVAPANACGVAAAGGKKSAAIQWPSVLLRPVWLSGQEAAAKDPGSANNPMSGFVYRGDADDTIADLGRDDRQDIWLPDCSASSVVSVASVASVASGSASAAADGWLYAGGEVDDLADDMSSIAVIDEEDFDMVAEDEGEATVDLGFWLL